MKNAGMCVTEGLYSRQLAVTIPHPQRPQAAFSVAGRNDPSTGPGVPHCFS